MTTRTNQPEDQSLAIVQQAIEKGKSFLIKKLSKMSPPNAQEAKDIETTCKQRYTFDGNCIHKGRSSIVQTKALQYITDWNNAFVNVDIILNNIIIYNVPQRKAPYHFYINPTKGQFLVPDVFRNMDKTYSKDFFQGKEPLHASDLYAKAFRYATTTGNVQLLSLLTEFIFIDVREEESLKVLSALLQDQKEVKVSYGEETYDALIGLPLCKGVAILLQQYPDLSGTRVITQFLIRRFPDEDKKVYIDLLLTIGEKGK